MEKGKKGRGAAGRQESGSVVVMDFNNGPKVQPH